MSARISLEQSTSIQGQWKQQSKIQNQNQTNSQANGNQPNSTHLQNSINSIIGNYGSNNIHGSPYTSINSGFQVTNPNQLSLASGNDQNILTQYGLSPQSKIIEKVNDNKLDNQQSSQQQINNSSSFNQQNVSFQNYMSSSQNGVQNTNKSNTSNSGNQQSNQNHGNSINSININLHQLQNSIQNGKSNTSTAAGGNNYNNQNNISQNQMNQNQTQGSNSSLSYQTNDKQNRNSQLNLNANNIDIQNSNANKGNNLQVINNSQIKTNNIVRSSGELKDKVTDLEKQTKEQIDTKVNKNQQDKVPTTLGQQIYETLMAQSTQTQPQNQQHQHQNQQFQQPTQQAQYNSNIPKHYSQNDPSSLTNNNNFVNNYSTLQQTGQTKNQIDEGNLNNAKNDNTNHKMSSSQNNNQIQNQDNGQSSINSARFSIQNYSQNTNNSLSQSTQYQPSKQSNNVRNSGVRNHTLERTDNVRSGNLNTKVLNNAQYNKGIGGLNTSSGAANTSQTSSTSTNNNLLRKSLEYNQQSGLSGLTPPVSNPIQSTTINLYTSPQQASQQGQNISQMNLNKSPNTKIITNSNVNTKESTSNEQKGVEPRFIDYYNKNKSPRDQMQPINKASKEKTYNITEYEALNQSNQQQHQMQNNNQSSQLRMSTSQNNQNQLTHQSSYTNLNAKTVESQQNPSGYIALGIELSSRSLERKVQPSSNKNSSQNYLSYKYLNQNQGKTVSGQLQSDQLTSQKNSRLGHHLSTTSNTSKNLKSSRSNTPTKSCSNSNFISPSPSFLGSTSVISGSNSKYQQGSNQRQQQGSNKNQQGNNLHHQQNKVNPFQVDQSHQANKNQNQSYQQGQNKHSEQNSQISSTNSTDKLLQHQQQKQISNNQQSNHSQSLAGQIVSIGISNNALQSDIAQKQSPRTSQNLQSQSQRLNNISQTILQSSLSNQLYQNNSNKSNSPMPIQQLNDKHDSFSKERQSINNLDRPKSQTITEPQVEKVSSSHHIDIKALASRYNSEAIQNFLDSQNARIAANQLQISSLQSFGQTQDDKRNSSINKQPQQLQQQVSLPVSLNPSIQNFNALNITTGNSNRLFISSETEANNQHYQFGNNLQSKSKSPVNLQKGIPKPFDFSQLNNSSKQQESKPLNSPTYPKQSYKPLTLNTEEVNHTPVNAVHNSSNSSKNKNAQNIQNKFQEGNNPSILQQSVNFKSQVSQKEDTHGNPQPLLQQQQFSSPQTQLYQNQPRSSLIYGSNHHYQGSPQQQNLSSKSREKINKKPTNSINRQFSDKKNQNNVNNKSPKSNNSTSMYQNPQQLSTTTSIVNDNSITYFTTKRNDKYEQQTNSANLSTSSPFTNLQADEHSTPTQTSNFGEYGSKSNISLLNDHYTQTFSTNLQKNSLPTPNVHQLEMIKVKEKMKKILELYAKKEKLILNENQELKNQIMAMKQTISNQQGEITQLKSQKNSFQNSNNGGQLQMSFQNLFNQEYSASKNQLSPKSSYVESLQVFQSPLEISFQQQHQ